MQLSLFRKVMIGFAVAIVGLCFAVLVAVAVMTQVANQLDDYRPVGTEHSIDGTSFPEETRDVAQLAEIVRTGRMIVLGWGLTGLLIGLVAMTFASTQTLRLLSRLKDATRQLANVFLDEEHPVSASDSMDDLEVEIRTMISNIQASHRLYLDASPLTRLPGNRAIEQVLNDKMARGETFALCYVDLDDFKAYNDTYGYARGSELIKLTGEIIYKAKDLHADPGDFVGHIGGDDFVLIVGSESAPIVCEAIIAEFDRVIPGHYNEDDRNRGYIECRDRFGVLRQFPLMTISIAVVSDLRRQFHSPMEVAQIATEIKDYVKTLPGSNYLIDRRISSRAET